MSSKSRFFSVWSRTLFTSIYFGFFRYSLWNKLISKFLSAVFVSVAEMTKILNSKFEDFRTMRALILILHSLFGCFLDSWILFRASLLDNNDCSMHELRRLNWGSIWERWPGELRLEGRERGVEVLEVGEVELGKSCWGRV